MNLGFFRKNRLYTQGHVYKNFSLVMDFSAFWLTNSKIKRWRIQKKKWKRWRLKWKMKKYEKSNDNLYNLITGEIPPTKAAWSVEILGKNCFYSWERERARARESREDMRCWLQPKICPTLANYVAISLWFFHQRCRRRTRPEFCQNWSKQNCVNAREVSREFI